MKNIIDNAPTARVEVIDDEFYEKGSNSIYIVMIVLTTLNQMQMIIWK